jgi:TRAP-type transport system large permease protein
MFEGQPVAFMLVVMALLLVVGCFLDAGAAIVLFAPLLMPVARSMGIDDLQFSMVMILTLTIGLITPPVGVCLFVACRIGDIAVWRLVQAVLPFLLAEVVVVMLLVSFPVLSSGLPGLLR